MSNGVRCLTICSTSTMRVPATCRHVEMAACAKNKHSKVKHAPRGHGSEYLGGTEADETKGQDGRGKSSKIRERSKKTLQYCR